MLPRLNRLPAKQRLKNSRYYTSQHFTLRVAQNNIAVSRFGFIVRKTVDKRSVVRNRVRRVFRSCIEEMLPEIKVGYDMLFSLEKGIIDSNQQAVCTEIKKLLREKHIVQ